MKEKWNNCETLGGKQKEFAWKYDKNKGLIIKRIISDNIVTTSFTEEEINKIIVYISNSKQVKLANSVTKLQNKNEKDGLGKFVYEELDRDISDAQAVSQLAAILVNEGILGYNGRKRGMEFWVEDDDWKTKLN